MKPLPAIFLVLLFSLPFLNIVKCEGEEGDGGGENPEGGHDQPPPSKEGNDDQTGNKNGSEQGYSQGFNQGVKPYSYGYNTGIKPYSYNFYQPYGGKPQVVHNDPENKNPKGKGGKGAQPPPPPIPVNIDFPSVS